MKLYTRYSLILLGLFTFIILAPLIVLYISGTRFNFTDRDTTSTGILDAKSNPSGAKVFVNGEENTSTPAIIRFLNQNEYEIKITYDGYFDWIKRLPVESGKVTYTQEGVKQIELIKLPEPKTLIPNTVTSFVLVNNEVWYSSGSNIFSTSVSSKDEKPSINVGFNVSGISVLRDKYHLFVTGADNKSAIVDTNSRKFFPLPKTVSDSNNLVIASANTLLYLNNNILYSYNFTDKTNNQISENIFALTMLDSTVYLANADGTINSSLWDGKDLVDTQTLTTSTAFKNNPAQLVITDRKALFFKLGSELFQVGETLVPILSGVNNIELNLSTDELTIQTPSELWFYNFLASKPQLLTRNSSTSHDFEIHSDVGYGFIASDSGLEAIEIDSRGGQNRYQLIKNGANTNKAVWQLAMTANQKTIVALHDGSLVTLLIRN